MPSRRFSRCGEANGFTLIELLIVVVIVGVLLAIAVPMFLGFRTRAADAAAQANIHAALAAAESYRLDNLGVAGDADNNAATSGYQGLTTARLRAYDRGIQASLTVYASKTTAIAFCLRNTISGRSWSALGPGVGTSSYKNNTTCT